MACIPPRPERANSPSGLPRYWSRVRPKPIKPLPPDKTDECWSPTDYDLGQAAQVRSA